MVLLYILSFPNQQKIQMEVKSFTQDNIIISHNNNNQKLQQYQINHQIMNNLKEIQQQLLFIITCILSYIKSKKLQVQQQIGRVRQMRIEENNQVQIDVPKQSIYQDLYFGVISYKKLVQQYPGLKQFEDCIICLESIKNGSKKQLRHCSVTLCFHIFHQKCLTSWLQKQQNCPFCREEFTIRLILNKYPWLDLKQQRLNNPIQLQSKYKQNMKYSSNTDQSQDNQLNDSQQELVRKDKIILEI
ncbi:unnamed protein product [Paramecium primaurelia]|uniref:RING-type domain-containing protein n=1 Tax=Paramecium primaurelia TaxID=5886 RepID=A0A8S1MNR7_PARPR|nr:unnamed protein product [Paramecium primaurelia]